MCQMFNVAFNCTSANQHQSFKKYVRVNKNSHHNAVKNCNVLQFTLNIKQKLCLYMYTDMCIYMYTYI